MNNDGANEKFSQLVETIRSWSVLWNLDELLNEIIESASKALNADSGYLILLESEGLALRSTFHKDTNTHKDEYINEIAEKVIRHGKSVFAHDLIHTKNNQQVYCVPLTANRGVLGVIYLEIISQKDIKQEETLLLEMLGLQAASFLENAILYHSAITDPLTGLYSHRHFQQEIEHHIRRAKRTGESVSLVIIDLDKFKHLNDNFGHEEGNKCLIRISQILKENIRSTDIIARFGGDEFEILLPSSSLADAIEISKKIIHKIKQENFPSNISATAGIANFPENAQDSQSLFLIADKALYKGKNQGRDQVAIAEKNNDMKASLPSLESNKVPTLHQKSNNTKIPEKTAKTQNIDGFEVIERVASGSNGEVLLVKQHELNRVVALKRPLTAHLTKEQTNAFQKEAIITASLNHPGVVPLYTMGKGVDDRIYYTMKPLKGTSLADIFKRIKENDPKTLRLYNFQKLIHILLKTAETISYAHANKIMHLDIHPENIIIGEFGEITLIDWGKGNSTDEIINEKRPTGTYISGNPNYRAPEVLGLTNQQITTAADIYSLGMILYEILTGTTLFNKNSIKETLEAIKNEMALPPSSIITNYSIDPMISDLAHQSVQKNISLRKSAKEFCRILSRFVHQETDEFTNNFLTKSDDMHKQEWHIVSGKWEIKDRVWSDAGTGQNMLFWKKSVKGNFSLTVEAWVENNESEISIIAFGKPLSDTSGWGNRRDIYQGYCFQFGADKQLHTKLARDGDDILINNSFLPKAGVKYIINLSFQGGWLYCYINGNLIFSFREFYPMKGQHIGFYTYGLGTHFKPLEIKYQSASLILPAISLADELFSLGQYLPAIQRYQNIHISFPDRLEGQESLLKIGICHTRMGNTKLATQFFKQLTDTPLEPFALAETANIELPYNEWEAMNKMGSYENAYQIYQKIFKKFPNSQAIFSILVPSYYLEDRVSSNHWKFKTSYEKNIYYKSKLLLLAYSTISPPSQTQVRFFNAYIHALMQLGQWKEAYEFVTENLNLYRETILQHFYSRNEILSLCYAMDKPDESKKLQSKKSETLFFDTPPICHLGKYSPKEILEKKHPSVLLKTWKFVIIKIIFQLAAKEKAYIANLFEEFNGSQHKTASIFFNRNHRNYNQWEMLIATFDEFHFQQLDQMLLKISTFSPEHKDECQNWKIYFDLIYAFLKLDDQNAITLLEKCIKHQFRTAQMEEVKIILTAYYQNLTKTTLIDQSTLTSLAELNLISHSKELFTNLLNDNIFEFSSLWPKKPFDCVFNRLIYAIWLFRKNHYQKSRQVLQTIINPSYGHAYFQEYIHGLINKIDSHDKV